MRILIERLDQVAVRLHHILSLLRLEHRLERRLELEHRLLDPELEALDPIDGARDGRHVAVERWSLALEVESYGRLVLLTRVDVLHVAQVGAVGLEQVEVLALQVSLDELALEQTLKRLDELEGGEDGGAVVEALVEHRTEPALELLDRAAEDVKVVVELLDLDVEHVVWHLDELLGDRLEVGIDLDDGGGEGAPLVAADLDALELHELHERLEQVEQVVAALKERVEAWEERGVLQPPRVTRHLIVGAALVIEVDRLELATHLERHHELVDRLLRLHLEELLRIQERACLRDEVIAYLAHEHHQARGRVVEARVLPHEHDEVHNRPEKMRQILERLCIDDDLRQLLERGLECGEVLGVVVRLLARGGHLLHQPIEGGAVGGFGEVEHLHDLADALAPELLLDRIQVARLSRPELELRHRPRMRAALEQMLRVELQHILDLLGPGDHRGLEYMHALFVLGRAVHRRQLHRRQRQQRLALGVSDGHVDRPHELVQVLHDVLDDDLGQPPLVMRVGEQRQVHVRRRVIQVLQHLFAR